MEEMKMENGYVVTEEERPMNLTPMKTEYEKMRSEELYCFADPEIDESIRKSQMLCA